MKVRIEAECTPEEARAFLGLPDLTPLNEVLVGEMVNRAQTNMNMLQPEELIDDLAVRCLAPLAGCGPAHGRRLAETLLAWLETRGGAPEVAARLGVHPQTVRYRLRQIRELWGDGIDDPDRRFELELVLRAQRLRGEIGRLGPQPRRTRPTGRRTRPRPTTTRPE